MTILFWRLSAWVCLAAQMYSIWIIDAMPLAIMFFSASIFSLAVADILCAIGKQP